MSGEINSRNIEEVLQENFKEKGVKNVFYHFIPEDELTIKMGGLFDQTLSVDLKDDNWFDLVQYFIGFQLKTIEQINVDRLMRSKYTMGDISHRHLKSIIEEQDIQKNLKNPAEHNKLSLLSAEFVKRLVECGFDKVDYGANSFDLNYSPLSIRFCDGSWFFDGYKIKPSEKNAKNICTAADLLGGLE